MVSTCYCWLFSQAKYYKNTILKRKTRSRADNLFNFIHLYSFLSRHGFHMVLPIVHQRQTKATEWNHEEKWYIGSVEMFERIMEWHTCLSNRLVEKCFAYFLLLLSCFNKNMKIWKNWQVCVYFGVFLKWLFYGGSILKSNFYFKDNKYEKENPLF